MFYENEKLFINAFIFAKNRTLLLNDVNKSRNVKLSNLSSTMFYFIAMYLIDNDCTLLIDITFNELHEIDITMFENNICDNVLYCVLFDERIDTLNYDDIKIIDYVPSMRISSLMSFVKYHATTQLKIRGDDEDLMYQLLTFDYKIHHTIQ